jgi:diguanylate cyclase (GGDEF)-like protein/PAS domain S-box-containing protein
MENETLSSKNSSAIKLPLTISLLVLAACLSITYYFSLVATKETERDLQIYFDLLVREAISQISHRIDTYSVVLLATGGHFNGSESVNRQGFNTFITSLALADYYPGIQGVGFSRIIAPRDLADHIASVRAEGFSTYSVYPEGDRDIYTSIVYLEPFSDRNLRAFGYDMYSDPARQQAMKKAAEKNSLSISSAVRLVQESGINEQSGFLMYLPIYAREKPYATISERQANIIGWAYSVFRMNDFMSGAQAASLDDIDIEIYDGNVISEQTLMYDSHKFDAQSQSNGYPILQEQVRFQIVDRDWTIVVRSLPTMALRVDVNNTSYVNSIGIITSFSLSLIFWLLMTGRQRVLATARNIHKELIVEKERLRNIIDGTHVGTWEWNIATGETKFNEYWAAIAGYTLSELDPISIVTWENLVHPDDLVKSDILLKKHFSGELPYYECEARMRHRDGHWVWVLDRGKVSTRAADGSPLLMFGTHEDITDRKDNEASMIYALKHDALTKIPNRNLFIERLQRALLNAKRNSTKLAVMFIDIDKFKLINDNFGHEIGDLVLIEVAHRIKSGLRESDTAARIGGDEFVVLLPLIAEAEYALFVAEKIRQTVTQNFVVNGKNLDVSTSIGIAIYPEHGLDDESLMKSADTAMYYIKNHGRNNAKLYQDDLLESKGQK